MQRPLSFWSSLAVSLGLMSGRSGGKRNRRGEHASRRYRNTRLHVEALEERRMLTTVGLAMMNFASENAANLVFTIQLNQTSGSDVSVNWATSDNTALAGYDYTASSGTATITAGNINTTVNVPILNDSLDENIETVTVTLSNPVNATIGNGSANGTINDDDNPPTVNIADASASEGSSVVFNVALSAASGLTITVGYATANGSATTSGSDYTQVTSGSVVFNPGETTKTISITTNNDSSKESDETLLVNLNSFTNVTSGDTQGVGTIIDNDRTGRTNADGDALGENIAARYGGVKQAISLLPGGEAALVYDSLTAGRQIVAIETVQPHDGATPTKIKAELTFGGLTGDTIWYNGSNLAPGSTQRFVLSANASSLPTGRYAYTVKLTEKYSSGPDTTRTFTGYQTVVNRNTSEFGANWSLADLDRLHVQDDGVLWVQGDNTAAWFAEDGEDFLRPTGHFVSLVQNGDDSYTLTLHSGDRLEFSSTGVLTERVDRNGNSTQYTYSSGKLATRTDPFGRETTFTYSSGKLSSVSDPYSRSAALTYTSTKLTNVELVDPDAGGAQAAPEWNFAYDSTTGLIEEVSDPRAKTTTYSYDARYRLTEVEDALSNSTLVFAGGISGFPTYGTEFSPFPLPTAASDVGQVTDALDNDTYIETSNLGLTTVYTDALGNDWTYVRNADGLVTQLTGPDPDGGGPRTAPVWEYTYDSAGNRTSETLPDETEQTWEYDATWNVVTRHDDPLGRITLYEIDAENGNVLSVVRVLGEIDDEINEETDDVTLAAYTYTAAPESAGDLPGGLLLTFEDALGRLTEYAYEDDDQDADFGRLLSITYASGTADEAVVSFEYDTYGNVSAVIDALSRETAHAYDKLNRLIETTLPDPDGGGAQSSPVWAWEYDAMGNVLVETDPLGNETAYGYDDRGLLLEITYADPDGGGAQAAPVAAYEYNEVGWLIAETDPLGNDTAYEYNDTGWLLEVTLPDPDGGGAQTSPVLAFSYDALGNVLTETDALGGVTTHDYDELSRRIETTLADPDGGGGQTSPVYAWEFDAAGQLTTATDALGRETAYEYNVFGWLVEMTRPDPDGGGAQTAPVWSWEYDAVGNMVAETNPLDETVTSEYGNLNRLVLREKTLIDGPYGPYLEQTETWEYNAAGEVIEYVDFLNRHTTFEHDGLGQLIEVTLPDPDGGGGLAAPVFAFEYDAVGNLLVEIDALGNETAHDYDNLYRHISTTLPDPDGGGGLSSPVYQFAYNAAGWLTKSTDALGRETTYTLDNLGRRVGTTLPDPDGAGGQAAAVYTTVFDAASNVVSETDPLGKTTNYDYDALHRLIETQLPDPDGGGALGRPTTTFSYDAVGNLLSLTDPVGNTTQWVYDALNRTIEEENELSASRFYEYDALNRLIETTDRRGLVTQFDFDFWGMLIEETWLDGASTVNTLTFAFDFGNQLLAAADDFSDYTFTYDSLGRVTQSVADNGGPTVRLTQEWDSNSNRTSLGAQIDVGSGYVNDFEDAFTFDNLSRLTRIDQAELGGGNAVAEKRIDLAYNANGLLTTITRYDDLAGGSGNEVATTAFAYDNLSRVTDLTHTHSTTTIADYNLAYDVASRLTQLAFTSLVGNDGTADYAYDDAWQLIDADHDFQTDEAYAYDENGNRTISGYSTGDNNQLLSDGAFDYEYDAEGNRVLKTNISTDYYTQYEYDHRNRLVAIVEKDDQGAVLSEVRYVYDVFDRRIAKWLDSDGDTTADEEHEYIYDGQNIVLAFDGAGDLTNRYVHGVLVDQVLADEQVTSPASPGDVLWPLADHMLSVRDIVDSSGSVVNHITYDAFGNITSEYASTVEHIFGFTGRERDEESDLYYYRARYYDPAVGRWVSEDPIGFLANDTNLARYVTNGPTLGTDPSGLFQYQPLTNPSLDSPYGPGYINSEEGREYFRQMIEAGAGAGWSEGPTLLGDIGLMADHPVQAAAGFVIGLRTGEKAVVNGLANAGWQTLTLGYGDRIEVIEVTDADRAIGYDAAEAFANGGGQLLMGAGLGKLAQAPGMIGKVAFGADLAGNAATAGQGIQDAAANGLNGQNGVQIILGGVGLTGNVGGALDGMGGALDDLPAGQGGGFCFVAGTPVWLDRSAALLRAEGPSAAVSVTNDDWYRLAAVCFAGLGLAAPHLLEKRRRRTQADEEVRQRRAVELVFADVDELLDDSPDDTGEHVRAEVPAETENSWGGCIQRREHSGMLCVDQLSPSSSDLGETMPLASNRRSKSRRVAVRGKDTGAACSRSVRRPYAGAWLAVCITFAAFVGYRGFIAPDDGGGLPTNFASANSTADDAAGHLINIEEIRVGQKVLAKNPDITDANRTFDTQVDPTTWKKLILRAEENWDDGTIDDINIETLQRPEWIAEHRAEVGAMVPVPLDAVEMGLDHNLKARVLAIERCPQIASGPGRVVLTTVNHLNRYVFKLTVRDAAGNEQTVGVTGFHKFYSTVLEKWLSVEALHLGESLGGADGDLVLVGRSREFGTQRVYNFTVEHEHVYFVSGAGALTHNVGCTAGTPDAPNTGSSLPTDLVAGQPIPLRQQTVNGVDIPLPDPLAGGWPHTTLGTRIGSDGIPYRQSSTFPGETWPQANGQDVPWSRVDWTDHGRPWDHSNPHQHIYSWDPLQKQWIMGPQVPFNQ